VPTRFAGGLWGNRYRGRLDAATQAFILPNELDGDVRMHIVYWFPHSEPQQDLNSMSITSDSSPEYSYKSLRLSGETSAAFFVVSMLAAVPVWLSMFPPMVDLPQHAAQVTTFSRMWDPTYPFSTLYEINWFTPYLFGYTLVWLFAQFFQIIVAIKIVVSAAVIGFLLAGSWLRRTAGGRKEWDWLLLPIPYGFVFEWGFLNFFLGAPLVLLFVREALLLGRAHDRGHAIRLAVFAHLLFFVHVLLAVFFCFILGLRAAALAPDLRQAFKRVLPFTAPVPITLLWAIITLFGEPQANEAVGWDWSPERLVEFFCLPFGLAPTIANFLAGAALFAIPFLTGGVPSKRVADWVPFVLVSILLLFLPSHVFGNYYTYQRFGLFSYPLYLIAFSSESPGALPGYRQRASTMLLIFGIAIAVGIHASNWVKSYRFDEESRQFSEVLSAMDKDKRALGLLFERRSEFYGPPMFLHFAAWYPALRGGATDFSFASFIPQVLRYPADIQPNWGRGADWSPTLFRWRFHRGWQYDYYIVKADADLSRFFFRRADCTVRLVRQVGQWWLYERLTGSPSDPGSCASRYHIREHPSSTHL
jgi:hypothetical protein